MTDAVDKTPGPGIASGFKGYAGLSIAWKEGKHRSCPLVGEGRHGCGNGVKSGVKRSKGYPELCRTCKVPGGTETSCWWTCITAVSPRGLVWSPGEHFKSGGGWASAVPCAADGSRQRTANGLWGREVSLILPK